MDSNIILKSDIPVSSDAETFYRDYWRDAPSSNNHITILDNKQKFVFHELLKGLPSGKNILEIGVGGEGGVIAPLISNNSVYGVDVSESAIASCRSKGMCVEKINCDFEALPYPDDTFDIVIALEVFEHFSNPQFVIEQIRRVMKPEACLIISTPSPYTYHWPRLFYPSLFEKSNFHNFLQVNRFIPLFYTDPMLKNLYSFQKPDSEDASFSYYWLATKLQKDNKEMLFNIGKNLLELKDSNGMRTMPIEALDLLKASIDSGNSGLDVWKYYLCALFYRFIACDTEEFTYRITWLIGRLGNSQNEMEKPRIAEILLEIHNDAGMYGFVLFDQDTVAAISKFILPRY